MSQYLKFIEYLICNLKRAINFFLNKLFKIKMKLDFKLGHWVMKHATWIYIKIRKLVSDIRELFTSKKWQ